MSSILKGIGKKIPSGTNDFYKNHDSNNSAANLVKHVKAARDYLGRDPEPKEEPDETNESYWGGPSPAQLRFNRALKKQQNSPENKADREKFQRELDRIMPPPKKEPEDKDVTEGTAIPTSGKTGSGYTWKFEAGREVPWKSDVDANTFVRVTDPAGKTVAGIWADVDGDSLAVEYSQVFDERSRGRGLYTDLLKSLSKQYDVTSDTDTNNAAVSIYKRLGADYDARQARHTLRKQGVAESGAETSWSTGTEKITLQDILELTNHIKQINLPINDNLKSKLIHWDGNPEEIERINQVIVSKQFPILIIVDEQGQIQSILDGNHRLHRAIKAQAKTIPAKLIKPSDLNDKAKRILHINEQGVAEGKVKLYTDPGYFGAEIDDTEFDNLPIINISANQLVGFEPDSKMNQPKSRANVEKIVAGLKQGAKLPPLLVRKYKNGYQVLDGHHRFWAYKLLGVKSIPSRIVPDEDIEEISKQGVAEGKVINTYLWHGSRQKIPMLEPRQSVDTGGAAGSNQNAIYATSDPKVAIAMGLTTAGSDTGMFPNDPQMVLFSGKIRKGEYVYLHKLPFNGPNGKPQFVQGGNSREFHSIPGVEGIKPIEIKEIPVNKYLNLIRKATPADLKLRKKYMKKQGVAEGSENNNITAQKIFFARSDKTPKGWSYDHVGFITQDGKQIQMSGHKGNDVYVTNDVTDDPEFPKQNIKIVSLSKPVSVPTTNSVGAENCGTFVANVLQANGIKGIDTQKIYSVFKQPQKQSVAEDEHAPSSLKTMIDVGGIRLNVAVDGAEVIIRPVVDGYQAGYAVFDRDGNTLVPADLAIDEQFRGQGIAKIIYDYVKSLGFAIRRSSDQTRAGKHFWDKNRGEDSQVWEQIMTLEELDEACWKGYHKEGMKTMFGKRYPNCVKNTNEDATDAGKSQPNILDLLRSWRNRVPAQYAWHLTKTFGDPHDATEDIVIWHDRDGFKRIEIKDEYVMHISPSPHYDYCYSYIDLRVPHRLTSALADCSESILIDHLKNEVGARCASLAANAVTLNFVMDVVAGRTRPSRDEYEQRIMHMHRDFENEKIFSIAWWPDQSHDTDPANTYYRKQHNSKAQEKSQPDMAEDKRIPRKAGQPANSKKHSDLYTDENPKGTIHGLKFATVDDAHASVAKIKSSGRSHAHKIQAAVAMEQRARAAGKASAAAVYRSYINGAKKTNESTEESCPHCNGPMFSEEMINEKKDACYYKVKSRYKVWPSAYASGALVQCRKKGASNWGTKSESSILEGLEQTDEDLHKWFKEKWVRFGPDGKIRGACARGGDSEGKPKCLPQSKAQNLGKKGRASAASRKRRQDPDPERSGKAINVATKKKTTESSILQGIRETKGLPMPGSYEQEYGPFKNKGGYRIMTLTSEQEELDEKWSNKYKRSIDCSHPKGFSQRAHCQGKKKK